MNVHRALSDVAEIRAQLEKATNFRGFRSASTGVSALVVLAGAGIQSVIPVDRMDVDCFLSIWLGVALISSVLAGSEMLLRGFRSQSSQVWRTHRNLLAGLLPALVAGSILTLAVGQYAVSNAEGSQLIYLLPGLWAMVYGLGLYSCRNGLPRPAAYVAMFYLIGGSAFLLIFTSGFPELFSLPQQMVILFGLGQTMLGFVLYWNVERANKLAGETVGGQHGQA